MCEDYSKERIETFLRPGELPWQIEFHAQIDSTNLRAQTLARQGCPQGTTVIADSQTAGRGRFDRAFYSPAHSGVYLSVVLRPEGDLAAATRITPLIAVAVARAAERVCDVRAEIKWVNDVYIGRKKCCGILCGSGIDARGGRFIVAGIGVNVAPMQFPEPIADIATSLSNACGKTVSRARYAAELLNEINALLPHMAEGAFMEEYKSRSNVIGRNVIVLRGEERIGARAVDIDSEGHLIVRTQSGTAALSSGEISLRFAD